MKSLSKPLGLPLGSLSRRALWQEPCVTERACVRLVPRDLRREQVSLSQLQILTLKTQFWGVFSFRKWEQTAAAAAERVAAQQALGTAVWARAFLPDRTVLLCFRLSNNHPCPELCCPGCQTATPCQGKTILVVYNLPPPRFNFFFFLLNF